MRKTRKTRVAVDPLESLTPEEAGELLAGDEDKAPVSENKFEAEPIWDVDAIKRAEDELKDKLLKSAGIPGGFTAASSSGPFRSRHVFEDDLEVKGELKGPTIEELKTAIAILKVEIEQMKKKPGFYKIPKDI